ncbi:MAG: Ig-like domain-containing protein, partial [Burkholderiaceae bacterium]
MPSPKHAPAPSVAHRAVHVAVHAPAHGHGAAADPATQALIDKGYVPARQLAGKVVGVWGQALLRDAEGHIQPLKVGHVIQKGEVVLTGQDGIVQLEGGRHALPGDLERVIAEVGRGDNPETAPAAGLQGGDGGDMQPGLRVDRISESVTPASIGTEPYSAGTLVARSDDTAPAATAAAPSVAAPDTVTVPEDTPVSFDPRTNDHLAGGGTPAVQTVGGQAISVDHPVVLPQGTVSLNPDGTLSFTPAPDFNGSVTIPYTVGDGQGDNASSTIVVTVTPVNDPPVAVDDGFTTAEDTPLVIDPRGNDSDADGDPLTVTQVNGQPIDATHPVTLTDGNGAPIGTVSLNDDGTLTFNPAPNYNGPADFDYTVSDGQGGTDTGHVGLTVTPVDDTPSIVDDSATTPEDQPVLIDVLANDSDGDGDGLTITQVNGHDIAVGSPVSLTDGNGLPLGEVRLTADGKLEFTPAPGTSGPVDFSYTATDGHTPVQANVHVDVTPVNDPPLAGDDRATVAEDTPITLNLLGNDHDADGDTLTITQINGQDVTPGTPVALDDGAGHAVGTVTVNADGSVTFDPAPGYNGPAGFTYTVSDGHGGSDTATVGIDVGGVNDAPVAAPDTGSTSEDATLVVDAAHGVIQGAGTDTDPDGDSLAVSDVAFGGTHASVGSPIAGAWGTLTLNADGSYSYVPNAAAQALHDGDSRSDVFSYTVTDPTGATSTTTLTLTVTGRNDAPVAVDDSAITPEDTPLTLDLRGNDSDPDGDPLAV